MEGLVPLVILVALILTRLTYKVRGQKRIIQGQRKRLQFFETENQRLKKWKK